MLSPQVLLEKEELLELEDGGCALQALTQGIGLNSGFGKSQTGEGSEAKARRVGMKVQRKSSPRGMSY